METEAEQKFLDTKQEPLRLSIALERFWAPELPKEWRERYAKYLRLRIRPAINRALELDDADKAERLLDLAAPEDRMLDEFIKMASQMKRLEILDLLLRRRQTPVGSLAEKPKDASGEDIQKGKAPEEERLRELGDRIWAHIRNKYCLDYPFLRLLWLRFTFQDRPYPHGADPETGAASAAGKNSGAKARGKAPEKKRQIFCGTDGRRIFYDAESLLCRFETDPDDVERRFLHMAMHVLLLHVDAAPKENARLWDLACDVAAKRMAERIAGEDRKSSGTGRLPKPGKTKSRTNAEQTRPEIRAERLYGKLEAADFSEDQLRVLEEAYCLDNHELWRAAGVFEEKELLRDVRTAAADLRRHAGAGDDGISDVRGTAKGSARETLPRLQKREISYRDFLERFAVSGEELGTDEESFDYIPYLFGLSHYKNMPLIEHLEYREVRKIAELVIVIDTSGSCKTETVRRFMEETYAILSDRRNFFKEMNVYILQCDFCVQAEAHITCEEEWKQYLAQLTVTGRSGTDFRPAFAYVEKLRQERKLADLKGLLYFTDGDGIYPETPTDYDTAFLYYREKERHQKAPDWAWTIRLEDDR